MNKATEAAMALKKAIDELSQVVNIKIVTATTQEVAVIVQTERDMDQIPGELQAVCKPSREYPVELRKEHAGVVFKCLPRVARTA